MATVDLLQSPTIERENWAPADLRRVLIRLSDGDTVQIGTAPNREGALTLARSVVDELEQTGEWPLVGDRLLRPDAIVSVDVVRVD